MNIVYVLLCTKHKRVVLKNNFKRHSGTMTAKGDRKRRKNWRHEPLYAPPPHDVYCSNFLRLLSMNIKMGSLEPRNNEYAWARLLDIFTLGSYKKKSPAKLRIVFPVSVARGVYNTLLTCISHRHWRNSNYFVILLYPRTNFPNKFTTLDIPTNPKCTPSHM